MLLARRRQLGEYVTLAVAYKADKTWKALLSDWVESQHRRAKVVSVHSVMGEVLQAAMPDDPFLAFVVKNGIAFVPMSNKVVLQRKAENDVRSRCGIPRIGEGWISEILLGTMLQEVCNAQGLTLEHHKRFPWLGRQHLDYYIPEKNVAVEFMGEQHFRPVEFFAGEKGFEATKRRDGRKRRLCKQNHVTLVYVRYDDEVSLALLKRRVL